MFRFVVPLHSIGLFLFKPHVSDKGYSVFNIISLVISVSYMIISVIIAVIPKKWERKMYEFDEVEIKPYSKCVKDNFTNCYWRSNPATKFALEEDIN